MKFTKLLAVSSLAAAGTLAVQAQSSLNYTFDSDVEGFQNVAYVAGPSGWADAPTVQQTHAAGGWQMVLTKEFSFDAGGGAADQQVAMQALANQGVNAHLAFDLAVDGNSFPAGAETWFQFNVVGNSDGSANWTQTENLFTDTGWHSADDATLYTMHIDMPFSALGWEPGDSWFQFWTGSNSDGAVAVNFYLDNVSAYVVPEPTAFALAGLGLAALFIRRRR